MSGRVSNAQAVGQLSFWCGHLPWLQSDTEAMDRTFWRVAEATGAIEMAGTP